MAKARAAYLRRLSRTAVRTVNPYGARAYSRARRAFSRLLATSAKIWTSVVLTANTGSGMHGFPSMPNHPPYLSRCSSLQFFWGFERIGIAHIP